MASHDLVWENCHAELDDHTISTVEAQLNCTFPDDFKAVVKKRHGGSPEPCNFTYEDPDIGTVETCIAELLSFDIKYEHNIVRIQRDLSDQLPEGIVPFAADAGGDYICFDCRGQKAIAPTIVYWSHESDPSVSLIFLCNTFSEFLEMLQ